jgi:hypothetical protein
MSFFSVSIEIRNIAKKLWIYRTTQYSGPRVVTEGKENGYRSGCFFFAPGSLTVYVHYTLGRNSSLFLWTRCHGLLPRPG